ncbi:SprT-like domain-containing protein [Haliea sp.]|uniref:SprT family zinc-dependent metalloprotease n=1 Tax=Haliea TaxID=475794 RepID=UPI00257E5CA1|nr:SprT-like domain-containing protein [Haliea sp.]
MKAHAYRGYNGAMSSDDKSSSVSIEPIGGAQRAQVIAATQAWVDRAAALLAQPLELPTVLFDLSGGSAGMFRVHGASCSIRYNPWIFARHFDENLEHTVPHEVAHYVVHMRYPRRRLKPHGPQWQQVMQLFGRPPRVTFDLALDGVPMRRQRRHPYHCGCREHAVSTVRHNRMRDGRARYLCRYCSGVLRPAD